MAKAKINNPDIGALQSDVVSTVHELELSERVLVRAQQDYALKLERAMQARTALNMGFSAFQASHQVVSVHSK